MSNGMHRMVLLVDKHGIVIWCELCRQIVTAFDKGPSVNRIASEARKHKKAVAKRSERLDKAEEELDLLDRYLAAPRLRGDREDR